MKAHVLANRNILLVPDDVKTIQIPGNIDGQGVDAMEYVSRFREVADAIEKYIKEEK
jgi:hypothetical protein